MKRRIFGSAAVVAATAAMLLGLTAAPAHANAGDCDGVGNGNYIMYVYPETSFTFQCVDGKWVFIP
jgi:hypothetical protein